MLAYLTRFLFARPHLQEEWRSIGVQQSRGWVHYGQHKPEPHILLMKRHKDTDPVTGLVHGKRYDQLVGNYLE